MRAVVITLVLLFSQSTHGLPSFLSYPLSCYVNPNSDGSCPFDDITFWLATRSRPDPIQVLRDNLTSLPVEEGAPWKLIFHGLNADRNDGPGGYLTPAYLARGPYNILLADYHDPFMQNRSYLCYPWAARNSLELVAACAVEFLKSLLAAGVLPAALAEWHVLGHSLGAHTAASVCHRLHAQGLGKVGRLTGLDPAGPLFHTNYTSAILLLEEEDALFVDVYHTNGGDSYWQFGSSENRGHADIRFNGGGLQPGCNADISCNHMRAIEYYAESIDPKPPAYHKFRGQYATTAANAVATAAANAVATPAANAVANAATTSAANTVANAATTSAANAVANAAAEAAEIELILVGEDISPDVQGTLYVITNSKSPYARD